MLKHVASKNGLFLVAILSTEFQRASGSNVRARTVRRELHEIGFHGRAAKPKTSIGWSGVKLAASGRTLIRVWPTVKFGGGGIMV